MDTVQFFAEDVELPYTDEEANAIKRWLFLVAETEDQSIDQINYIFCSDEYLLNINKQYLKHDYYTDIITFDNRENESDPLESDIFISLERVADNATSLNTSENIELKRVLIHGLLHLCGYDDKLEEDEIAMRKKEDHYLSLYNN